VSNKCRTKATINWWHQFQAPKKAKPVTLRGRPRSPDFLPLPSELLEYFYPSKPGSQKDSAQTGLPKIVWNKLKFTFSWRRRSSSDCAVAADIDAAPSEGGAFPLGGGSFATRSSNRRDVPNRCRPRRGCEKLPSKKKHKCVKILGRKPDFL